jgi:hypothetical protein
MQKKKIMVQALKIRTLTNWHPVRWLRLIVGIAIVGSGIQGPEWVVVVLGSLLTAQAILDMGCASCAGGGCSYAAGQFAQNEKEK